MNRKFTFAIICLHLVAFSSFADSFLFNSKSDSVRQSKLNVQVAEQQYFVNFLHAVENAYPENYFGYGFDCNKNLWFFNLKRGNKKIRLYYKEGRCLTEKYLDRTQDFIPLYCESYSKIVPDPKKLSHDVIELVAYQGSALNRKESKPSSFIIVQNFLYDAETRGRIEKNIVQIKFLDGKLTVHKKIIEPLKNIEEKLYKEAETDADVKAFISQKHIITGYNWREVRDTYQRSSHSWGISIDYVPARYPGKQIYWRWTKGLFEEAWVYYPLKKRWMPPEKVISIFESEGFIWGGKWLLWDNMHFEYHPELIYLMETNPF